VRIPVQIHHNELEEEYCYFDKIEKTVICADYESELQYTIDEVELEYDDLIDIVNEYFDDLVDIILKDKQLTKLLLKRLARKTDISSVTDSKR